MQLLFCMRSVYAGTLIIIVVDSLQAQHAGNFCRGFQHVAFVTEEGKWPMKHHYIAGSFCLIYAGLSLYQGFHDGEMSRLIWTGIALAVLGVLVFFRDKLSLRLKTIVVVLALILMGVMVIKDFTIEDMVGSIVGGIALVYVVAVALFHDRPFAEGKVRSWSTPFACIMMGVLVIFKLLTVFAMDKSIKLVGEIQKPSVSPGAAHNSYLQAENGFVYDDFQQKGMDILTSEETKQKIKAADAAGTTPEFLESFSNFKDYMISKGMTEFTNLDLDFQGIFQKQYPGKVPSDLDPEMRQSLIDMIQEFGYEKGRQKFLTTREIGIWAAARFNLLSDNQESITAWIDGVYIGELRGTEDAPGSTALPPVVSQEYTPSIETEQEQAEQAPSKAWKVPEIPDTEAGEAMTPKVVTKVSPEPPAFPTKEELEASLKEQFSSERFDRAMSTLERYGPEEGLRRLREDDPEVANQIESSRRAGVERHRKGENKKEDSQ